MNSPVLIAAVATMTVSVATPRQNAPVVVPPTIDWDARTLTLIQPGAGYGRMARLPGGEIVCAFEWKGGVWMRHSRDEGKTWAEAVHIANWPQGALANPEVLPLKNGSLLVFSNGRPRRPGPNTPAVPEAPRFTIFVSQSDDKGRTWTPPVAVYEAGAEFQNGCWEPAGVQMASGDVHLFFANENPYTQSDEQEITRLVSRDGGRTWGKPEAVSFRAKHRDGMPVPLVLKDGVVLAIEDNGYNGNFKPVIIFLTKPGNDAKAVAGDDARRWGALQPPLSPNVYAGAPYLRQLPTGETVLSFQKGDDGKMDGSRMAVSIGDKKAHNFAAPSYPFGPELGAKTGSSQLWNALFVKDKRTITAISSTTVNGIGGVWAIDGKITHGR